MIEGILIDIFEPRRLDTILVRNMDRLGKSTHFMDALTWQIVGSMYFITPIADFVKKPVESMGKEASLEKALEHQLSKPGMMKSSQPSWRSTLHSFKPHIPTPQEGPSLSGSDGK